MKPSTLLNLINELNSLPGIGKKQAERIAYYIIQNDEFSNETLADSIIAATRRIHKCKNCGHFTEDDICYICADKSRKKVLVIVESPLDVFKFEETQTMRPYYHVLGGLINISKKIDFEELNISNIKERAKKYKEVILALSPNLEGIVTSNYLKNFLDGHKVTQLAQGIPLGSAMEYVDELTLKAAIENRKEIK